MPLFNLNGYFTPDDEQAVGQAAYDAALPQAQQAYPYDPASADMAAALVAEGARRQFAVGAAEHNRVTSDAFLAEGAAAQAQLAAERPANTPAPRPSDQLEHAIRGATRESNGDYREGNFREPMVTSARDTGFDFGVGMQDALRAKREGN
jgi:hypothetical protein